MTEHCVFPAKRPLIRCGKTRHLFSRCGGAEGVEGVEDDIFREVRETNPRYTLEFKAMVVMTADKENLEVNDVATKFDISYSTAYNWMAAKKSILETYCMRQKLKENSDAPFIVYAGGCKYELLLEDPVPKKRHGNSALELKVLLM